MSSESGGQSVIGKFFVALGLKIDDAGISKFKSQVQHLTHSVELLGVAFGVELVQRVGEFVERSVGAAAAINDFAEITDMSAEKVAALGRVAVENSSSMEAMQGAIMGVSRAVGMSSMGIGRHVKLFQQLGIAVKDTTGKTKTADAVMLELADKFKTMDTTKRNAIAGRLGIDPLIAKAMADAGSEGWRKQVQGAMGKGLLSKEDFEQADQTEKTFKRFHILTGQIATLLANQLGPWIRKVVDATEEWLTSNKATIIKKIHEGGQKLAEVLGRIWDWGVKIWGVVVKLEAAVGRSTMAWAAMKIMLVAIAGLKFYETINSVATAVNNLWLALTKIPAKAAAIGMVMLAIGLLVEDFIAWKNGEESVLKDLSENWPNAIGAITKALNGMLYVWNEIVAAAQALGLIDAAPEAAVSPEDQSKKAEITARHLRGMAAMGAPGTTYQPTPDEQAKADLTNRMLQGLFGLPSGFRPTQQILAANGSGAAARAEDINVTYVQGNTVVVQADTPQRAREAGKSIREALSPQKIRNYQPGSR